MATTSFEQECSHTYALGEPIITDPEYDDMVAAPDGPVATLPRPRGRTVKLPVWMGSMDKCLGDNVDSKLSGLAPEETLVITDKLDGISALVVMTRTAVHVYSRGDGAVGQDITHLMHNGIGIPRPVQELTVRGELIVAKAAFDEMHSSTFSNPRNMVAGCANSKIVREAAKVDIRFVAYELVSHAREMKPSQQLDWLQLAGFTTAPKVYRTVRDTDGAWLAQILAERKAASVYELDGLVLARDCTYTPVTSGNPTTAFAYKNPVAQETAIVEVKSVIWDTSRFGRLIPVVAFAAVPLAGVMVSRATAHNHDFVQTRGIGVGAHIRIVRSGEVIPKILETVQRAEPAVPDVPHKVLGVQAIADAALCPIKRMSHFFSALSVRNAGPATIERLVAAGAVIPGDVARMDGDTAHAKAGTVLAASIPAALIAAVASSTIGTVLAATSAFGPGIGETMLKSVFSLYGDRDPRTLTAKEIAAAPGVGPGTASKIVRGLDAAYAYIAGLEVGVAPVVEDGDAILAGQVIVFSGCRDKSLQAELERAGAKVSSSGSAATILVVKDAAKVDAAKAKAAIKAGARVVEMHNARTLLHVV